MLEEIQITKEKLIHQIYNKKILAIDFGEKRIGLATTDKFHISLNPLPIINNDADNSITKIKEIVKNENVEFIIIGFPFRKDGQNGKIQNLILEFKEKISKFINLPVLFWDESGTSKVAVAKMIETGIKKSQRKQKANIDRFAAISILQNFLDEIEGIQYEK